MITDEEKYQLLSNELHRQLTILNNQQQKRRISRYDLSLSGNTEDADEIDSAIYNETLHLNGFYHVQAIIEKIYGKLPEPQNGSGEEK